MPGEKGGVCGCPNATQGRGSQRSERRRISSTCIPSKQMGAHAGKATEPSLASRNEGTSSVLITTNQPAAANGRRWTNDSQRRRQLRRALLGGTDGAEDSRRRGDALHCKWGRRLGRLVQPANQRPRRQCDGPKAPARWSTWRPNPAAAAVPSLWDAVVIPSPADTDRGRAGRGCGPGHGSRRAPRIEAAKKRVVVLFGICP